jgi:hypothetical protein
MKRTAVGVFTVLALAGATFIVEAAPSGVVTLSRKLRAKDPTAKISEVELDGTAVKIEEATAPGAIQEPPVPRMRSRPLRRIGKLDPAILSREVNERFRDFELCRVKVARLAGIRLDDLKAGQITARWTILPGGDTRDTLVLEVSDTALAVMRCARRRMNAWRFTGPVGGPVEVEYDYDFSRPEPAGKPATP